MAAFEICVTSPQGCRVAEDCQATRVELCSALTEGGLTPSLGMVQVCRDICQNVKLHVLIRPRGGDFLYDKWEVQTMVRDIQALQRLQVDGVVIGCLTPQGQVDVDTMQRLLESCEGLNVTFHRAFDVSQNPAQALEDIIALGLINRILTSGAAGSAEQGIPTLAKLHQQAQGRISLMAGAGVNERNIAKIAAKTGIQEFHFSAKDSTRSLMVYHNPQVFMGLPNLDEYAIPITSAPKVKATMQALEQV